MTFTINVRADSFPVVSICLIPGARKTIGKAAYLGVFPTVFGHPGRRFGQMAEALILVLGGTLLGLAWSTLGIYLGSLVMPDNPAVAYTIRGTFLAIATIFHGFIRSQAPRLFIFVFLLIIVSVVTLTSVATAVTRVAVTQILYPIFIAAGIILLINLLVFPEFSSSYLGETTIETLNEIATVLRKAGQYFTGIDEAVKTSAAIESGLSKEPENNLKSGGHVSTVLQSNLSKIILKGLRALKLSKKAKTAAENSGIPEPCKGVLLGELTTAKGKLRKKTASCKGAQRECNFEIAYSVIPPQKLKSISSQGTKRLLTNTIAIIGACESKYALLGDVNNFSPTGGTYSKKDHPERSSSNQNVRDPKELLGKASSKEHPANIECHKMLNTEKSRLRTTKSKSKEKDELDMIKPRREIESGDAELLRLLLKHVAKPYKDMQAHIDRAVNVISACIAYAYVCSRRDQWLHHRLNAIRVYRNYPLGQGYQRVLPSRRSTCILTTCGKPLSDSMPMQLLLWRMQRNCRKQKIKPPVLCQGKKFS